MDTPQETFDATFTDLVREVATHELHTDEATTAMKNLEVFSKVRPPEPDIEPILPPEPTTFGGKAKLMLARAWDNETTRVFIKAGGAFGGVALVTYATIRKDYVFERNALAQASRRNS